MENKIFNENNIITMSNISDKSISGIITSPPYNISTKRKDTYYNNGYSDKDGLPEEEYLRVRLNEFKEFSRIMEDTGVICYNLSYHNENTILPTLLMTLIHQETDLTLADMITWKKSTAIPFLSSLVLLPFLVVMITTPLDPSAPYNADAAAPFSTVTDSISFGLMSFSLLC